MASSLEVSLSDAFNLVTHQPTLLLAKVCVVLCLCRQSPWHYLAGHMQLTPTLSPNEAREQQHMLFTMLCDGFSHCVACCCCLVASTPQHHTRRHPPQPPAILGSLDVLSAALKLPSPSDALQLLVRCPSLLYDITIPAMQARLEQLSVVLACSSEEAREAARKQPVSLFAEVCWVEL